ncbi:Smr domain protein [uncultured Gammaproteobacteria bacterium]|jgi:DNA-nicking Smr family endonuclease|nr:Smr domain protein [Bathymodiolus brooksi thiotrophic gill symbiont]CAC9530945.1 Smr domain protein [uncultured Gammaproteobacteria bacterium]CAB9543346.1 Smr domain protein [Bathymodiolus brooksi thiotrophic gill symbiont]CAC9553296.1 Smr domain protein [uncultured Gammaproteobacteria bacterium]CAC9565349.1 Smr domain protein [uncultured Gammaproteobacteria bacterium]
MYINDEDKQLFRDTVDTEMPMDKDGGKHINKVKRMPPFTTYSFVLDGTIGGEEIVHYAQSGISKKQMNIMKHGHIDNAANIDLHGYTIEKACAALSDFMYHHQFEHFVHIIHGKGYRSDNGMSVLKTQVMNFLKQHPQVLAFHSCPPKDGGTGAVFALLKK